MSRIVNLFSMRRFDFKGLQSGTSEEVALVRGLPVADATEARIEVRIHDRSLTHASSKIDVIAKLAAPSVEEPDADFVGSNLALARVQSGSAPALSSASLSSAELAMKEAADQPVLVRDFTHHAYDTGSASKFYIPFKLTSEVSSLSNSQNHARMVAPYSGYLDFVQLDTTSDSGSTTVGFHKNDDNTASHSQTETVGASSPTKFLFGPSATFTQGDRLSISVDPTNAPTDVNVDCVWVFGVGTG